MSEPLEPALQRYIYNLTREMIGHPHILNPFNTGMDGIDLQPPPLSEDKPTEGPGA